MAQASMSCDLCMANKNTRRRCLNCDLKLCLDCAVIHCRLKPDHYVLDMFDIGSKSTIKDQILEQECTKHKDQTFIYFCRECKCLICRKCHTNEHKLHEVLEICDFVNGYRGERSTRSLARTVSTGMAYICSYGSDVCRVNMEIIGILSNKPKLMDRICGENVRDLSVISNEDVLLCISCKKSLKIAKRNSRGTIQWRTLCKFPDLQPISVHYDKFSKIVYVGLTEKNAHLSTGSVSTGQIQVISLSGDLIYQIEHLFTKPTVIRTSVDTIFVVDHLISHEGRIVALDKNSGSLKWILSDPQNYAAKSKFYPKDVCVCLGNEILTFILDGANDILYISQSDNGTILDFFPLENFGIENPSRISYGCLNYIWINSKTLGKNAQIFKLEVKLTEKS